jgi:hypothetical protein
MLGCWAQTPDRRLTWSARRIGAGFERRSRPPRRDGVDCGSRVRFSWLGESAFRERVGIAHLGGRIVDSAVRCRASRVTEAACIDEFDRAGPSGAAMTARAHAQVAARSVVSSVSGRATVVRCPRGDAAMLRETTAVVDEHVPAADRGHRSWPPQRFASWRRPADRSPRSSRQRLAFGPRRSAALASCASCCRRSGRPPRPVGALSRREPAPPPPGRCPSRRPV